MKRLLNNHSILDCVSIVLNKTFMLDLVINGSIVQWNLKVTEIPLSSR